MLSRRSFLGTVGAGVIAASLEAAEPPKEARKKLAIVTTEWRYRSHAWHMAERFLHGYPREGRWYRPPIQVVSKGVALSGSFLRRRGSVVDGGMSAAGAERRRAIRHRLLLRKQHGHSRQSAHQWSM